MAASSTYLRQNQMLELARFGLNDLIEAGGGLEAEFDQYLKPNTFFYSAQPPPQPPPTQWPPRHESNNNCMAFDMDDVSYHELQPTKTEPPPYQPQQYSGGQYHLPSYQYLQQRATYGGGPAEVAEVAPAMIWSNFLWSANIELSTILLFDSFPGSYETKMFRNVIIVFVDY